MAQEHPLPGADDIGLRRLTASELFPQVGLPMQVNAPVHHGDIPLHDHDFIELVLVTGGRALHRTIHGQQVIGAGDAFVIHPGQWHAYEKARALTIYNCCFGVELLSRELSWVRSDPVLAALFPSRLPTASDPGARRAAGQGVLALRLDGSQVAACVHQLDALCRLQHAADLVRARGDRVAHLLLVLGVFGRQAAIDHPAHGQAAQAGAQPGPIATAIHALEERLEHPWALDELAALAGLNRSYLVRLFRRGTGLSPMAYLARRRAEKAAVLLLTTDLPVAAVGRTVGWADPNYFARRFRAAFGITARDYRAQLPTPALGPAAGVDGIRW